MRSEMLYVVQMYNESGTMTRKSPASQKGRREIRWRVKKNQNPDEVGFCARHEQARRSLNEHLGRQRRGRGHRACSSQRALSGRSRRTRVRRRAGARAGHDAERIVHRVRILDVDRLSLRLHIRGRDRGEVGVRLARVDRLQLGGCPNVLLLRLLDVLLGRFRRQWRRGRDRAVWKLRRGGRRPQGLCEIVVSVRRWW